MVTVVVVVAVVLAGLMVTSGPGLPNFRPRGGDMVVSPEPAAHLEWETSVSARRVDLTYRWDITMTITKVTIFERDPTWAYVGARIDPYARDRGPEGLPLEPLPPFLPAGVGAFYLDNYGSSGGPDVGDQVIISGLSRAHQGAEVDVAGDDFSINDRVPYWSDQPYGLKVSRPTFRVLEPEERIWNAYVTVETVDPDWERIPWEWLWIRSSRHGVDGIGAISRYPGDDVVGNDTAPYFEDVGAQDGLLDPGDRLWIGGIDTRWGDTEIRICTGGQGLAEFVLPDWPSFVGGSCTVSEPVLSTRTVDGVMYSDIEWVVTNVSLTGSEDIPWEKTHLALGKRGGYLDHRFHSTNDIDNYGQVPKGWADDVDRDGAISVGDVVHLSGLNEAGHKSAYPGGKLIIHRFEMTIGVAHIPDILPGMNLTVRLENPVASLDGARFTATFEVSSLYPADALVPWTHVNFSILDPDVPTVLVPRSQMREGDMNSSIDAIGWYVDGSEPDGIVSKGDVIRITGLGQAHLGARLHLDTAGTGLCNGWLPFSMDLPDYRNFTLRFLSTELEMVPVNGSSMWRLSMDVSNTTEVNGFVRWGQLTFDVMAWNATVIHEGVRLQPFDGEGSVPWDGLSTGSLAAWYKDDGPEGGYVDEGDIIAITGISEDVGGAGLHLRVDGKVAYETVLPGTLPG